MDPNCRGAKPKLPGIAPSNSTRGVCDDLIGNASLAALTLQVTCILFGAEKLVESRLTPALPFDLSQGTWGAVELVFRVAGAAVGASEVAAVGNTLAGQSNRVVSWTAGANWYPVKNVRLSANWIFEDYRRDVNFGNGAVTENLNGLLFRFQIDF